MNKYIKIAIPAIIAGLFTLSSCSESNTNTVEKTEINTMDSTTRVVDQTTDKLEDQTEKVEQSLEKLDKEFETSN